jgi:hypothetical protein
MFRFLISAFSTFVLLTATLFLPQSASARRCEERMPVTLLSLYRQSDSIYVGRYEKTEDGEVTEETEDYRVIPIKKHFSISSALKGTSRKMLSLSDTEYRYKNQEAVEEESEHVEEESDAPDLQPGDSVLLFVKKSEESDEIELTDFADGVKKMTPDKLAAYEARIRELKGIFAVEKPRHSQIVDWLIKCAEDPLTRWEGTFELLQSFQNMDWQDERAKQAAEKPVESEPGESDEYAAEEPKAFETGDPNFAKAVTEAQKRSLTNILLNRERPKKSENVEEQTSMADGDRELIELVKRWGDSKVAGHLLAQLSESKDATQNSELMLSIASMLHDDVLTEVSTEYSEIQWETDEDVIRALEENVKVPESAEPTDTDQQVDADVAVDAYVTTAGSELNDEGSEKPSKKKTYGELRSALMAKFLDRAGKVIAKEQSRNIARLNR